MSAPKKRTTFYIPKDLLKKFKIICVREGEKMSAKIEGYMRSYVIRHEEGNPQLRLDKMLQITITKECSFPRCNKTASYEAWATNKTHVFLCDFHKERDEKLLDRWQKL